MRITTETAQLAMDTILRQPTHGVPTGFILPMEHAHIERLAGFPPGSYKAEPEKVYIASQKAIGACLIDQYIPRNPLKMGNQGWEGEAGATTGAHEIVRDGMLIDSPEAAVEHMEKLVFPQLEKQIAAFDEDACVQGIIEKQNAIQEELGPTILKTGYGFVPFPTFRYGSYGYANYFMAYALYPEVIERDFSLQADLDALRNRAAARAYAEGNLPPLYRLDHDMADSRGTLVDVKSLDRLWFPHFARALAPMLDTDVRMIWHCDGNLMEMVPRLLEVGLAGFQGFQYEDGMDYERICKQKTRDGEELIIMAGVSVTTTLPHGTPDDVKAQMEFLVEHGPRTGLFLAASSSITPGVPWENLETFVEGLRYYRQEGRGRVAGGG